MFQYLKDNLLCSSDGSDGANTGGRPTTCCTGSGGSTRRRPGEVISSQGTPVMAMNEIPSAMPWDNPRKRSSTPVRTRNSGSPVQSFRSVPSFNLGSLRNSMSMRDSISAAGSSKQDDPGCGLYVNMQRGHGPRDRERGPKGMGSRSGTPPPTPMQQRRSSSRTMRATQAPGPVLQAAVYEALSEDPIDRIVQDLSRRLPQNGARALLMRRFSRGDYEVDGCRVALAFNGKEVYAYRIDDDERADGELLSSYLLRAADAALARSLAAGPMAASFASHTESMRMSMGSSAPLPPPGQNGYGGVLVRGSDGGSFLLGGSLGGSFYSNAGVPAAKDPRMEAMGVTLQAGLSRGPTSMQGGSFYTRPDQSVPAPPPPPNGHGIAGQAQAGFLPMQQPPKHAGGYPGPQPQVGFNRNRMYGQPSFVTVG
ncbi:unnamed protein product [Polarella glacialis]|uniref:Uncharacterized protein n=1 Tax=Polarella glacialis TaxID=89957 RepID=A0A813LJU8_POLGL|nr:unnamed protein product [Polarella glacialis]